MSTLAKIDNSRQSGSDREMGAQLTAQYERATGGMREVLKFGAMMMMLRVEVVSKLDTTVATRGPTAKDTGVKKWIEEHAPKVQRSTAYRFEDVAKAVVKAYELPARITKRLTFEQLVTTPAKNLDDDARSAQEKLFAFVDGTSQKSLLDNFRAAKPFGAGLRDSQRKHTPHGDPNDPAEVARDIWRPIVDALALEGLEHCSWKDLPRAELVRLKELLLDLGRKLKGKASS